MDPKGYYSILGIPENATTSQIRKAYRSSALKYHPDRNNSPTAADMMRKINEAYEVLSDEQKRLEYNSGSQYINDSRQESKQNPWWDSWVSEYEEDDGIGYKNQHSQNYGYSQYHGYDNLKKHDYKNDRVDVLGQMIGSVIPIINFWIFGRIQRLEMIFSSMFPILIGLFVLLAVLPGFPFFP
ncbi:MAG: J domain-containing protein [Thermoproteota archaeon]|nr:J domain-containing protein [Thermoproteota archaeon]